MNSVAVVLFLAFATSYASLVKNPAANSGGCELVSCPEINPELALHLPNPLDCSSEVLFSPIDELIRK